MGWLDYTADEAGRTHVLHIIDAIAAKAELIKLMNGSPPAEAERTYDQGRKKRITADQFHAFARRNNAARRQRAKVKADG